MKDFVNTTKKKEVSRNQQMSDYIILIASILDSYDQDVNIGPQHSELDWLAKKLYTWYQGVLKLYVLKLSSWSKIYLSTNSKWMLAMTVDKGWQYFFFFEKQTHIYIQEKGKRILTQRHTTTPLKSQIKTWIFHYKITWLS